MIIRNGDSLSLVLTPKILIRQEGLIAFLRGSVDYLVLIIAGLVSFLAWRHYFDLNLILSYNDSMSHLDIARRVVEGLKPGFAQIGSVWLPLPHMLMLPFVWNDFLWHSGLAGSITSILAFVGSTFLLYRLVKNLTKSTLSGILAAAIFLFNPNMAYMQAIPMTESLLIFFFIASVYFLFIWQKQLDYKFLALAALFALLGTLTRYDGWMLLGQMVLVILIIAFRKGGYKKAESSFFLFITLAIYGVILWFIWNLLIFNDPLYFFNGPFSAKAQQLVFESDGRLFSKGNLLYSSYIYGLTIIKNNGAILSVLALVGSVIYFFKNKLNSEALVISLLFSPLIFNIAALYSGNSIINLPDIPPYTMFNVRYGLMMLPAVAVLITYLARNQKMIITLFMTILILQSFFMYRDNDVITVKDGISGASAQGMTETGSWLNQNAKEGLILVASSSQDALIFQSNLPMKRFITEGTGDYWTESLKDPTKFANFVAMHHGDLVYEKLATNELFLNNYKKVYDGEFTDVFQKTENGGKSLTAEDLP
jgi:hypothetical protein